MCKLKSSSGTQQKMGRLCIRVQIKAYTDQPTWWIPCRVQGLRFNQASRNDIICAHRPRNFLTPHLHVVFIRAMPTRVCTPAN